MSDIQELTNALVKFREDRDWQQFHNPKDLAIAVSVEAGELLEAFLWKAAGDAKDEKIREELADVLSFAILLAHEKGMDIKQIILEKLSQNALKYPVEKSKGTAKKYTEL